MVTSQAREASLNLTVAFIVCHRRTEAISDKDDDSIEDDDDDVQSPPSRSRTLNDFLAESVREKLFGSADFTTLSAAQFRFTQKRIPYIYIYVISTNPEHASSLVALFRGVPCILYRLTGNDFIQLPPLVDGELSKSPPITIYNGIGVDRVANIIGTKALFPKAKHLLVIDGGTALTYTTMVRVPHTDNTNNNSTSYRLQMGGGICPGMQMRFRSLFEYTANLPLAETSYVKSLMNRYHFSLHPRHLHPLRTKCMLARMKNWLANPSLAA
jgi:Type III pantothenate kinase